MKFTSRITQSFLAIAIVCGSVASVQAQELVTLLVDYTNPMDANDPPRFTASTDANFSANDAAVESGTPVNFVISGATTSVTGTNITADTNIFARDGGVQGADQGGVFLTEAAATAEIPLLDSYVSLRRQDELVLNVSGIEEFEVGSTVTATIYAIGDADNQDGVLTFSYNGVDQGPVTIEADTDDTVNFAGGFTTFTFDKVAGVDSFEVSNVGNSRASFRSINGFSLTGTAPTACYRS